VTQGQATSYLGKVEYCDRYVTAYKLKPGRRAN
jgi:hypothetical protein